MLIPKYHFLKQSSCLLVNIKNIRIQLHYKFQFDKKWYFWWLVHAYFLIPYQVPSWVLHCSLWSVLYNLCYVDQESILPNFVFLCIPIFAVKLECLLHRNKCVFTIKWPSLTVLHCSLWSVLYNLCYVDQLINILSGKRNRTSI